MPNVELDFDVRASRAPLSLEQFETLNAWLVKTFPTLTRDDWRVTPGSYWESRSASGVNILWQFRSCEEGPFTLDTVVIQTPDNETAICVDRGALYAVRFGKTLHNFRFGVTTQFQGSEFDWTVMRHPIARSVALMNSPWQHHTPLSSAELQEPASVVQRLMKSLCE